MIKEYSSPPLLRYGIPWGMEKLVTQEGWTLMKNRSNALDTQIMATWEGCSRVDLCRGITVYIWRHKSFYKYTYP